MEDLLDLYEEAYDVKRPVICFDEKPYQLIENALDPIKASPGTLRREDYEYTREGTCNIFVFVDPKGGKRQIKVTERRTKQDFAECIREMVDVHYAGADKIRLVLDNLNTHRLNSLYETFSPSEARRIIKKLELHYTPKHGSWLNMAEIEISALVQQSLKRRLGNIETVTKELEAVVKERNRLEKRIYWTFSTEQARIKLSKLYC
jgi:hypothetical protein